MDLPLSDQVIALIRFGISAAAAAFTVWGCIHFGLALGLAYFAVGLGVICAMQLASGPALRTRNTRNTPTTTDDTDDTD